MILLKLLYKNFLKEKTHNKYIEQELPNAIVIGENMLKNYYLVLLLDCNFPSQRYICPVLIVENCKSPIMIQISHITNTKTYIRIRKNQLKEKLESGVFNALINNGLFLNIEAGRSKLNNLTTLHRLNACLYSNILSKEVHHNDKDKLNNFIHNLTPLKPSLHDELDMLKEPEYTEKTQHYYSEYLKKLFSPKRNILTERDEFIFEILVNLCKGLKPIEIAQKYKRKISLSKIYEIKNYFYYLEEFIQHLYLLAIQRSTGLYGILNYHWIPLCESWDEPSPPTYEILDLLNYIKECIVNDSDLRRLIRWRAYY